MFFVIISHNPERVTEIKQKTSYPNFVAFLEQIRFFMFHMNHLPLPADDPTASRCFILNIKPYPLPRQEDICPKT